MAKQPYRYEAKSLAGFVQQLVRYAGSGYRYYVVGEVRRGKAPEAVDRSLLAKFDIAKSPQQRARAKQRGEANVQYIRFQDVWVMMVTPGRHDWFDTHSEVGKRKYKDLKEGAPLRAGPYSIQLSLDGTLKAGEPKRYRVRVSLNEKAYKELRALYLDRAVHWSVEKLAESFGREGRKYLPYRRVREQLVEIVRQVNKRRKVHGYEQVPYGSLNVPAVVRSVPVFEEKEAA